MAIQKTVTTIYGLSAENAYHRIESVSLISKNQINFHVRSYVTKDKPFFAEEVLSCAYVLDGDNPIKQAYTYIKTLSDYAGGTDC